MTERVISDLMPRSENGTRDIRPVTYVFADQKKRCFRFMACQDIQQSKRVRIVGTIVIGQPNLPGIGTVRERAAIELRLRRHGGISCVACSASRNESDQRPKH